MADNGKVIRDLYDALDRHDGETMAQQYAPDARFKDPAFGELTGEQAGDMWRMLCSRTTDLEVDLSAVDLAAPELRADPHPVYRAMRAAEPVFPSTTEPRSYLLTGFADDLLVADVDDATVLSKPYEARRLAEVLERTLGSSFAALW